MTDTVIQVEHLSKLYRIGRTPKVHSHRRDAPQRTGDFAEIAEKNMANLCVLPSTEGDLVRTSP